MTIGDKINTGLRHIAARLASGEKIEATTLKPCPLCRAVGYWFDRYVGHTCPQCGGSGMVRERVELIGRK